MGQGEAEDCVVLDRTNMGAILGVADLTGMNVSLGVGVHDARLLNESITGVRVSCKGFLAG